MKYSVLGSISIDNLIYNDKEITLMGSSAIYASLSFTQFKSDVSLYTTIGNDFSPKFIDFLKKKNINLKINKENVKTKRITLDYRCEDERKVLISGESQKLMKLERLPYEFWNSEFIYLCTSNYSLHKNVSNKAKRENIPLAFSPQGDYARNLKRLLSISKNVNYLFVNKSEIKELENQNTISTINQLTKSNKDLMLFVTLDKEGSLLFKNNKIYHTSSYPNKEIDSTGAGDFFATSFIYNYNLTNNLISSLKFATFIASESISQVGYDFNLNHEKINNLIKTDRFIKTTSYAIKKIDHILKKYEI